MSPSVKDFSKLFKQYRLLSQFNTLSSFSNALEKEGFAYDPSILSHWQNGSRVPSDRELITTIIKIFIKHGGVTQIDQANEIFESLQLGNLTEKEKTVLLPKSLTSTNFQVPRNIDFFIERISFKEVNEKQLVGNVVLIHGLSGSGKTSLAIKFATDHRATFPDGVIWIQLDASTVYEALNHIGLSLGKNVTDIKNIHLKAAVLRSYLSNKKVLIILDNVQNFQNIELLLPNGKYSSVIITSTHYALVPFEHFVSLHVEAFSKTECKTLLTSILGEPYYSQHQRYLEQLAANVGNLPLAIYLTALQLRDNHLTPQELLNYYEHSNFRLETYEYNGKNLAKAINLSITNLDDDLLKTLKNLSLFSRYDFSLEMVQAFQDKLTFELQKSLSELTKRSLLQCATLGRYKLHPIISIYCEQNFGIQRESLIQIAKYFEKFLRDRVMIFSKKSEISNDVSTIIYIIQSCIEHQLYVEALSIWLQFSIFLWNTGRWEVLEEYGEKMVSLSKMLDNPYTTALLLIRERSWFYMWRGNKESAEDRAREGLLLGLKQNNEYLIAFAKQRLGAILADKGIIDDAENYLIESSEAFSRLKEEAHKADGYIYLGHVSKKRSNFQEAIERYTTSLKIAIQISDRKAEAIANSYLGSAYYGLGNYQLAEQHHTDSYEINLEIGSKVGIAFFYLGLAKVKYALADYEKCELLLIKSREHSEQLELKDLLIEIKKLESSL